MSDQTELLELEKRRLAALASSDFDALAPLFSDDYVHCHATAMVHDKAAMLAHVRKTPRSVEPRVPTVRVYGDVGVLTGEMVNRMPASGGGEPTRTILYATQVARRIDGIWIFVSFHATRIRAAS